MKHLIKQRGFTFIEVLLTLSIFATLLGIITLSLTRIRTTTSIATSVDTLIASYKDQQNKAMTGDGEGRGSNDSYGIYFGTSSYTLFHGATYTPSDTTNFSINLDSGLEFASPGAQVLFSKTTGNVAGYSATTNTIIIRNSQTLEQKTLQYNQYGVITSVF